MNWFMEFITNPYLVAGMSSWLVAQVLKVVIHSIVHKKFDILRLFGDGGMPSGHSATVTAVATMSALLHGTGSFEFAISAILAIIVCHDAMGVRMETGKQTMIINEILKITDLLTTKDLPEVKLKEFVGHTPLQVVAGVLTGFINTWVVYCFLG